MANSALALLDNQRATAQGVFAQINSVMNAVADTAQQTARFTLAAAEQGYKMREDARMNDAKLAQMQFTNDLAAQEHNARMQLMPLQVENERLKLEANKANAERAIRENKMQHTNSITAPYDAIVASNFAKNQNPDYAKSWLEAKSKIADSISRGIPVSEKIISETVDYINSQYGSIGDPKGYNPEVSQLLKTMGANTEAARYEMKNPVFAGNLKGLKGSAILQGPEGVSRFMAQYGTLISDEDTTNMIMAAGSISGWDDQIEKMEKDRSKYTAYIASIPPSDPRREAAVNELEALQSEITSIRKQRNETFAKVIGGEAIHSTDGEKAETKDDTYQAFLKGMREEAKKMDEVLPSYQSNPDDPKEVTDRRNAAAAVVSAFPEATKGLSLKEYGRLNVSSDLNSMASIKKEIIRNLEEVDDIEALFRDGFKPGKDGKSKFGKVFDKLGENDVVINDAFRNDKYDTRNVSSNTLGANEFGKMNLMERIGDLGGLYTAIVGKTSIENQEDLQEIMRDFRGTEEQRVLLLQDLYANMVLAGIADSLR